MMQKWRGFFLLQCTLNHSLLPSNIIITRSDLSTKQMGITLPSTAACMASFTHHLCNQPQQAWGRAVLQCIGSWQCCTSSFPTGKQLKLDRDVMTCDFVSWATGGRQAFFKFSAKISLNNNIIVCLRHLADCGPSPGKARKGKWNWCWDIQ